jgi:prepilin-type N-terminal cleavage/methylation domain-containing protein
VRSAQAFGRSTSGFTLIELVISAALMTMILVSAYFCLSAAFSSQKIIEPRADTIQNARVAMAIMSADLRGACPLSTNYPFLGMHRMVGDRDADNLDFATHNYTPRRSHEGDFCEVSFFVDKDPVSGTFTLWRRRNPTLAFDPLSGGRREEIARGLLGLKFEYYDGFDWYDTWGDVEGTGKQLTSSRDHPNLFGLPDAVRITLLFDRDPPSRAPPSSATAPSPETAASPATPNSSEKDTTEPPLVFPTVARLNLAHSSERGVSGGSTTRTISDTTGQPVPVPGSEGGY